MELPGLPYWADFGHSLLTNVSQVVLVDNALGGALIVLGLFLAHWKVGLQRCSVLCWNPWWAW